DGVRRQDAVAHLVRERGSQHLAPWPLDEAKRRPALAAQCAGRGDQPSAAGAYGRKQDARRQIRQHVLPPLELRPAIGHEKSHPAGTISEKPAIRHHPGAPRSFMEPIFDHDSLLAKKRRALRIADAGASFLMQRAAGDLEDRLAAVERRFDRAASLFSMTSEASDAVSASGKAETVGRVEADAALLAQSAGEVAPPETLPFEPES